MNLAAVAWPAACVGGFCSTGVIVALVATGLGATGDLVGEGWEAGLAASTLAVWDLCSD